MKKLLAVFALLPSLAFADVLYTPNKGGGEVVLTGLPCVAADGNAVAGDIKKAYAWTAEAYTEGCWSLIDGNVHIYYPKYDEYRVYKIDVFRVRTDKPEAPKKKKEAPAPRYKY